MYTSKVRTESTTTHPTGSHLLHKRPSQIAALRGVIGMVLADGCLRDLHGTTVERLGVLMFALQGRRPRNPATGTPWYMASDRTLLTLDLLRLK